MKVLLVISEKETSQMISFALENQAKVDVLEKNSADAIALLVEGNTCDVIVCEFSEDKSGVLAYLAKASSSLPCVILTRGKPESYPKGIKKVVGQFQFGQIGELCALIKKLGKGLPASEQNQAEDTNESLCRIRTNLLIRVSPLRSSIYVRLSEKKFLKIFQEGDIFDVNDLERYQNQKQIEHFYLRKVDCGEFIAKFQDDLQNILNSPKLLKSVGEEVSEAAHETVHELINKLGATPAVQGLVKSTSQVVVKNLGASPRLSKLLQKFISNPKKYISSHSNMLGQIACAVSAAMHWSSESTFYKLNLAAFLHDITLENESLAAIQTLEELEERKTDFTEQEIEAYKVHPLKAAELVRTFADLPADVDTVILQHHERPDGTGFPRKVNHMRISPMAATFIVAHDIVLFILANNGAMDMPKFIQEHQSRYDSGAFKKILKTLSEIEL